MAYHCKYCGKLLDESGSCTCEDFQNAFKNQMSQDQTSIPQHENPEYPPNDIPSQTEQSPDYYQEAPATSIPNFNPNQQPQQSSPSQYTVSSSSEVKQIAEGFFKDLLTFAKELFKTPATAIQNLKEKNNFALGLVSYGVKTLVMALFIMLTFVLGFKYGGFRAFITTIISSLVIDVAFIAIVFVVGKLFNSKVDIKEVISVFGVLSLITAIGVALSSVLGFISFFRTLSLIIFSAIMMFKFVLSLKALDIITNVGENKGIWVKSIVFALNLVVTALSFQFLFKNIIATGIAGLFGGGFL